MIEKELETLKRNWFSDVDPTLEGNSPICIEMLDTILEKLRKLDDEELVKELDKLSYTDRWCMSAYVIEELAYEDRRKIAEPYVVDYDKEPEPTDFS
ncbi:MAG: hypothetical protein KH038_02485 [Eubacterium sp.]|jgi:hypothetical protein|nr:hypothetical protein [Eubacterium sp.]DAV89658.1 MAG TPA: hypothetical protein [Caudoviricetes sp.]